MPKRTRPYRESLLEDLQDPAEAADYLNAALNDSDEMLLVALRDVAEARQMSRIAEQAGVAREALYRMLRKTGNPTYANLMGILSALGVRIIFAPAGPLDERTNEPPHQTFGISAKSDKSLVPIGDVTSSDLGFLPRKAPAMEQEIGITAGSGCTQIYVTVVP